MGRILFSLIAGIFVGSIVVFIVELINTGIFPPPTGLDLSNNEAMSTYITSLPSGAFLMIILAHALGAGSAGFVTAILSRSARMDRYRHGLIGAAFILLFSIINFFTIPHPVWVIIIDVVLISAAGMMGSRFGAARSISS